MSLGLTQRIILVFSLLIALFFGVRISMVTADVPKWGLYNYSQIDESYYNLLALNFYKTYQLHSVEMDGVLKATYAENLLANAITTVSLFIFGDNYYGFRLGHILFSTFAFFLFLLLVYKATRALNEKLAIWNTLLLGLIFSCSQSLVWPNVINEPTGTRLSIIIIFVYMATFWLEKNVNKNLSDSKFAFNIGLLAAFCWLFVYPSNVFLIPTSFIILLVAAEKQIRKDYKSAVKPLMSWFGAIAFTAIIFAIFRALLLTQGENLSYSNFSDRIFQYSPLQSFDLLLKSSFLRDNFSAAIMLQLSLGILFFSRKIKSSQFLVVSTSLYFLVLQLLFINDYPFRKTIVLFPLLLLLFPYAYHALGRFKFSFYSLLTLLFLTVLSGVTFYLFYSSFQSEADRTLFAISAAMLAAVLACILFLKNNIAQKCMYVVLIMSSISSAMQLSAMSAAKTENFKYCMQSLNKSLPKDSFVFGFSHGFWLYNSWTPVGDEYVYNYNYPPEKQENDADVLYRKFNGERSIFKIALVPQSKIDQSRWAIVKDIDFCTDNPYARPANDHQKLFLLRYNGK